MTETRHYCPVCDTPVVGNVRLHERAKHGGYRVVRSTPAPLFEAVGLILVDPETEESS